MERIIFWATIQLAGIDFVGVCNLFEALFRLVGLYIRIFAYPVCSVLCVPWFGMPGYGGLNRVISPSIASPALIRVTDGKPNPCWATGSVAMLVDGWKGSLAHHGPSAL
jgi:hypothetical protein